MIYAALALGALLGFALGAIFPAPGVWLGALILALWQRHRERKAVKP